MPKPEPLRFCTSFTEVFARKERRREGRNKEGKKGGKEGRKRKGREGRVVGRGPLKRAWNQSFTHLPSIQPGMNNTMTTCRHRKPNPRTTAKRTSQLSLKALHLNSNWQSHKHHIHYISSPLKNHKGPGEDTTAVFKYLKDCHTKDGLVVFCMSTKRQVSTQLKNELTVKISIDHCFGKQRDLCQWKRMQVNPQGHDQGISTILSTEGTTWSPSTFPFEILRWFLPSPTYQIKPKLFMVLLKALHN